MSLFWRLFLANLVVVIVAFLVLVLTPVTISHDVKVAEAILLAAGAVAMMVAIALTLRKALRPLTVLAEAMAAVDTPQPAGRVSLDTGDEIGTVAAAYNAMLDRLDAERDRVARATLLGQEAERRRVAAELHDEVGQILTVALLRLGRAASLIPPELAEDVVQAREATRASLEVVREITSRLRPAVLEDLGLARALTGLATHIASGAGLRVQRRIEEVDGTTAEQDLVIYRVTQEALTNVARHAGATSVAVSLRRTAGTVEVEISDDGVGIAAEEGNGLTGMRERARLVQGELSVGPATGGGTRVRLSVPVRHQADVDQPEPLTAG